MSYPERPYAYRLIDPRTEAAFYVGKGTAKRAWDHGKRIGMGINPAKDRIIDELQTLGLVPIIEIVSEHETDAEAFAAEIAEIARLGIENLTNLQAGGPGRYHPGDKAPPLLQLETMPRAKSPSPGIGRPLTDLRAVVDRGDTKLDALIEATAALAVAVKALVEANTPKPFVGMGPTFNSYQPDGRGSEMARFCEEAGALPASPPQAKAGLLADAVAVPRGTEPESDPSFDPMADMALELAEMAAEDDEPPPPPDEWEVWERRVSTYRSTSLWIPSWGPRPGQEGCLVPYEMLDTGGR